MAPVQVFEPLDSDLPDSASNKEAAILSIGSLMQKVRVRPRRTSRTVGFNIILAALIVFRLVSHRRHV